MTEMPERIRSRRRFQGLTGYQLARRVQVSPSYISLIEGGKKVPTEDLAEKIARALGEPEKEYRIWAATARMDQRTREAIRSVASTRDEFEWLDASGPESRIGPGETAIAGGVPAEAAASQGVAVPEAPGAPGALVRQEDSPAPDAPEPVDERRQVAHELLRKARELLQPPPASPSGPALVPLLRDGVDLEDGPLGQESIAGEIPVQAELRTVLGEDTVALRVTAENGGRVSSVLRPGDTVVLDRRWSGLRSGAVYAVKLGGALVLARCIYKNGTLVLLDDRDPAEGAGDVEVLPLDEPESARPLIAGRVVWSQRTWR